ncbi:hypothetical protein NEILACOT_05148 [Neisseria lactamica ATCC 23970]|uniref:Uncharacterized protein n=1 Tax=Neisseria lactamica ATCC 23970 TaxID=546265 RepID=D0WC68_NEILA|nr:hypothetical protein NEILACOT_05148 [Neisseria lactamica ATCC 23970]
MDILGFSIFAMDNFSLFQGVPTDLQTSFPHSFAPSETNPFCYNTGLPY